MEVGNGCGRGKMEVARARDGGGEMRRGKELRVSVGETIR